MKLQDYIKGNRKGKDAHSLEKEAMQDPFLHEALEGFDSVDDDHMARIASLRNRLKGRAVVEKKRLMPIWLTTVAAVAVVLLAVVAGSRLLLPADTDAMSLYADASMGTQMPISIYLPEAVYVENIAMIATKNTELTKDLSIVAVSTKKTKMKQTEDENISIDASVAPIEIFIPIQQ